MFSKMLFATRVNHDTVCTLANSRWLAFTSSEKVQEIGTRKQDGRWHRKFNYSMLKRQRNWVDKQTSLKNKEKEFRKKKLIDTQCENNINTVAKELVLSQNIASYVVVG